MPIRRVSVSIDHTFEVDIPDELLQDGWEDALDDYLYSKFEDEDWIFDELSIYTLDGRYI